MLQAKAELRNLISYLIIPQTHLAAVTTPNTHKHTHTHTHTHTHQFKAIFSVLFLNLNIFLL